MNPHPTSKSNEQFTENAQLRLRLWRERFTELLSDLEGFLPARSLSCEDTHGVPVCSSSHSGSQA
jgi:hypothetical protein